ncbi:hypothetical protein H5410_023561 [Solanum commersonii]|uniref:Uncharacterized protein n=1 Tax=Solanum commersonii TaxID=4109 RepID=A0A9J5ZJH2_SOLCO|nr:hypothetical protein H5410_023561 [Solanum commersonii]
MPLETQSRHMKQTFIGCVNHSSNFQQATSCADHRANLDRSLLRADILNHSTLLSQHLRNTSFNLNCSDILIQSRLTLIVATILLVYFVKSSFNLNCNDILIQSQLTSIVATILLAVFGANHWFRHEYHSDATGDTELTYEASINRPCRSLLQLPASDMLCRSQSQPLPINIERELRRLQRVQSCRVAFETRYILSQNILEEIHPEASEIIMLASNTTNSVASDTTSSVALSSQHQSTLLSQHLRNTSFNLNYSDVLIQSRLTSIVATILLEVFGGLTISFSMNITDGLALFDPLKVFQF